MIRARAQRLTSTFEPGLRAQSSCAAFKLKLRAQLSSSASGGKPSSLLHENITKVAQEYKSNEFCLALKTFRSYCLCLVDPEFEKSNEQQVLASSSSMEFNPESPAFELGSLPWRTTCKLSIPAQTLVSVFELGLRAQPSSAPSKECFERSHRAQSSSPAFDPNFCSRPSSAACKLEGRPNGRR